MWCYQKPGFEAILLTELQRQQQCSQFCDTLLKTGGVSVPAHSCILSAISPHMSSALSSTPPPPAGQSRLLEFRALGACSLLRLVGLLYSGEMSGEGEEEKREAVSAAAMLGIHGLVEVTRRDCKSRNKGREGQLVEVGVQTELLTPEEKNGRGGRWTREARDGSTFVWKETLSDGERDTWTQTEELQVNTAPPSCPAASFETIDMAVLQSLGQTDPDLLPPQIPYVPLTLFCPQGETQTHQPSFASMESTAAGNTSVAAVAPAYTSNPPPLLPLYSQPTTCAADPQSCWAGPERMSRNPKAAEEWEDERFEQFQGNIPGYINHFLNMDREKGSRRRRARGRQGARGSRRAGTGERRVRRPRGRTAGRGRGGLTQTVDVQEVGVSGLHKLFLQRWGMRASRTGQGGGAAGRKLHLKTRELLNPARSCQRRRGRREVWGFSLSGDVQLCEGGAHHKQRGRRNMTQQFNKEDLPVVRAQRAKAKPTASYVHPPASSLLHTTSAPPPNPPAHEEQPEHFDRLLEEVMMGLHILPNNNGSLCSQPPPPTCACSGYTLAQNKQQGQATSLLEAGPGFHESTQVVAGAAGSGSSSSANNDGAVVQQQGELNDMLEHFLQSFEQHVHSCVFREEVEMGGQSCKEASVKSFQITEQQQNDEAKTPARPQRKSSSARSAVPPKHTEETPGKVRARARRQTRRAKNQCPFPPEKPASLSDAKNKIVHDREEIQVRQMPVVKLERSGPLPPRLTLQGHSCQHVEVKCPAETKFSSSSVKCRLNQPVTRKTYPIRSRLRKSHIDSKPCLEEPLSYKDQPSGRCRPRKNGQLLRLTNGESSMPPVQTQPVNERLEKKLTVQPQEAESEGPTRRGKKRGAESKEETDDDGTVARRVCFEIMQQPSSQTYTAGSESADLEPAATEIQDVNSVKPVSLPSVGNSLEKEGREENQVWSEVKLDEEMDGDKIIDGDGDVEDDAEKDRRQSRTAPTLSPVVEVKPSVSPPSHSEVSLGSTEVKDEDIDVIGGSSPIPDLVIIDWTESAEDEEEDEDVDIVGEATDCSSLLL